MKKILVAMMTVVVMATMMVGCGTTTPKSEEPKEVVHETIDWNEKVEEESTVEEEVKNEEVSTVAITFMGIVSGDGSFGSKANEPRDVEIGGNSVHINGWMQIDKELYAYHCVKLLETVDSNGTIVSVEVLDDFGYAYETNEYGLMIYEYEYDSEGNITGKHEF